MKLSTRHYALLSVATARASLADGNSPNKDSIAQIFQREVTPENDPVRFSVLSVLHTAIPSDALSIMAAQPTPFNDANPPGWYNALPGDVKSLLPSLYPVKEEEGSPSSTCPPASTTTITVTYTSIGSKTTPAASTCTPTTTTVTVDETYTVTDSKTTPAASSPPVPSSTIVPAESPAETPAEPSEVESPAEPSEVESPAEPSEATPTSAEDSSMASDSGYGSVYVPSQTAASTSPFSSASLLTPPAPYGNATMPPPKATPVNATSTVTLTTPTGAGSANSSGPGAPEQTTSGQGAVGVNLVAVAAMMAVSAWFGLLG